MNHRLNGGCQVPIAGYAELEDGELRMRGLVASVDGKEIYRAEHRDSEENAEQLGLKVAEDLLSQGAGKILQELYDNKD